jgi:hypothetical protein
VTRAVVELVLAVAGAVGCAVSWIASRSSVVIPPVDEGEPATTSVVYYPPLLLLALVLATVAGVLLVVGVARLLRERARLLVDTPGNDQSPRTLAPGERDAQ